MLRENFTAQAGPDVPFGENRKRIQIVAFLSPFRKCTSYTDQTRLLNDENSIHIPPQLGMGTAGYRVLTVYEDEWLEFGKRIWHLETRQPLEILHEGPRHLYRSRMIPTSYMRTDPLAGDILVDDDGGNPEMISEIPLSVPSLNRS